MVRPQYIHFYLEYSWIQFPQLQKETYTSDLREWSAKYLRNIIVITVFVNTSDTIWWMHVARKQS